MTPMHKQVDVIEISGFEFYLLSTSVADDNAKISSRYSRTVVTISNNCCTIMFAFITDRHLSVMQMPDSDSESRSKFQIVGTDMAIELLLQSRFLRSHYDLFALNNVVSQLLLAPEPLG